MFAFIIYERKQKARNLAKPSFTYTMMRVFYYLFNYVDDSQMTAFPVPFYNEITPISNIII